MRASPRACSSRRPPARPGSRAPPRRARAWPRGWHGRRRRAAPLRSPRSPAGDIFSVVRRSMCRRFVGSSRGATSVSCVSRNTRHMASSRACASASVARFSLRTSACTCDERVVISGAEQDRAQFLGVSLLQALAPLQVSGPARGRGRARHGPPPQVMAPRGEQEGIARVGPEPAHPLRHEPRVQQFLRAGLTANRDRVRVGASASSIAVSAASKRGSDAIERTLRGGVNARERPPATAVEAPSSCH